MLFTLSDGDVFGSTLYIDVLVSPVLFNEGKKITDSPVAFVSKKCLTFSKSGFGTGWFDFK